MNDTINRRYATILYKCSRQNGTLPEVIKATHLLKPILERKRVVRLLASMDRKKFHTTITTSFAFPATFTHFLQLLQEKRRLNFLPSILTYFLYYHDAQENQENVFLTSRVPLSKTLQQLIVTRLTERLQKRIVLRAVVDPNLLGGFRVQGRSFIADLTLQRQLHILEQHLEKYIR